MQVATWTIRRVDIFEDTINIVQLQHQELGLIVVHVLLWVQESWDVVPHHDLVYVIQIVQNILTIRGVQEHHLRIRLQLLFLLVQLEDAHYGDSVLKLDVDFLVEGFFHVRCK